MMLFDACFKKKSAGGFHTGMNFVPFHPVVELRSCWPPLLWYLPKLIDLNLRFW